MFRLKPYTSLNIPGKVSHSSWTHTASYHAKRGNAAYISVISNVAYGTGQSGMDLFIIRTADKNKKMKVLGPGRDQFSSKWASPGT